MKVTRRFTQADKDVYESTEWTTRSCKIASLDGSTVFEMNDVKVPKDWSQLGHRHHGQQILPQSRRAAGR